MSGVSPGAGGPGPDSEAIPNRALITVSIMLATVMSSLDTTIANVALPHIQGSVSASADQITWVLTSYIVAAAIMTPLTGWLAGRIGRKLVFMVSVAGFTVASALCGLANSLVEIVLFRLLQGLFGAALIPLSQAVLLDINPPEKHGQAMALWGAGAILGPILGPALGGWLTDNLSWRWVFFINLPIGVMAFTGIFLFIREHKQSEPRPFDFFGFATLAIAIAAFQLFLDRGQTQDWFSSVEVQLEAAVAALSLFLFIVQMTTAKRPFVDASLFKDGNFVTATIFGFFIGILLFSSLALLPPFMENLLGYSVVTTGLVSMPRGLGSFVAMFAVGQLMGRVDVRLILLAGLSLTALSAWQMMQFTLVMPSMPIMISGVCSGLGTGLIFVPLSTLAFATIPPDKRTEAAGLFTLVRNIGSSAGISIMTTLLSRNADIVHSGLVEHIRPDNPMAHAPSVSAMMNFTSQRGLAMFDALANQQASMIAYIDDFKLMLWITILSVPMLLLMRPPKRARGPQPKAADNHAAFE
jgi:DHA2 family multidrug resistance protein